MKPVFLAFFSVIVLFFVESSPALAQYYQSPEKLCPTVLQLLDTFPDKNTEIKEYLKQLKNSDTISNETSIYPIFGTRKRLCQVLAPILETELTEKEYDTDYINTVFEELKSIGFRMVFAEGQFIELTTFPILEQKVKAVGSEYFQLETRFYDLYANSLGGEYPFVDFTANIDMFVVGEMIKTKFPKRFIGSDMEFKYNQVLVWLTDIHKVIENEDNESPMYILSDAIVEAYPMMTSLQNLEYFTTNYPTNPYAKTVARIMENISEIKIDENREFEKLNLIVISQANDKAMLEKLRLQYLKDGKDIPHIISFRKQNKTYYALVYRFFSNRNKAETALKQISKEFRSAKIISIESDFEVIEN